MLQKSGVIYKNKEGEQKDDRRERERQTEKDQKSTDYPQEITREEQQQEKKGDTAKITAEQEEKKLNEAIDTSRNILFSCKTLFPFDFFPDTIIIDRERISVIVHMFFRTEQVKVYEIANYKDIIVGHGPLISTVRLLSAEGTSKEDKLEHLKHGDAAEIGKVIRGILRAREEHIDLSKIESWKMKKKIEELGEIYE